MATALGRVLLLLQMLANNCIVCVYLWLVFVCHPAYVHSFGQIFTYLVASHFSSNLERERERMLWHAKNFHGPILAFFNTKKKPSGFAKYCVWMNSKCFPFFVDFTIYAYSLHSLLLVFCAEISCIFFLYIFGL